MRSSKHKTRKAPKGSRRRMYKGGFDYINNQPSNRYIPHPPLPRPHQSKKKIDTLPRPYPKPKTVKKPVARNYARDHNKSVNVVWNSKSAYNSTNTNNSTNNSNQSYVSPKTPTGLDKYDIALFRHQRELNREGREMYKGAEEAGLTFGGKYSHRFRMRKRPMSRFRKKLAMRRKMSN